MPIPTDLQSAIDEVVSRFNPSELKRSSDHLSEMYRNAVEGRVQMRTDPERCAYLAMRLPGTYSAVASALQKIRRPLEDLGVRTLLDLGAGPGTAAWAAITEIQGIEEITLFEKDPSLIQIGKTLAASAPESALSKATWRAANLESSPSFPHHDLVMASYALSELSAGARDTVLRKAWAATGKALLLLEPGTPLGFRQIREMRETLLGLGAQLLAPCPHALSCPMTQSDWCHFSVRVPRTKLHRYLKSGDLGYEDEKFSYLAAVKAPPASLPEALGDRLIRHPQYSQKTVDLTLCTTSGAQKKITVRKSEGALYKAARKAERGDLFSANLK